MSNIPLLAYGPLLEQFPGLPQSSLISHVYLYAQEKMPAYLFNHVVRSWIFAVELGKLKGIAHDPEVLAAATLLHDIGLTDHAAGPHRFEVNGAEAAVTLVRELGFDNRRAQLVWDSIALHATPSISLFKEAEVALCARGIGVDFGAPDYQAFAQAEIDNVVAALPRLKLKSEFTSCLCHMARTRPETTYDNLVRDFGERYVPGYEAPSWVDRVLGGPFSE
jgi:hypothetical protein